MKELLELRIYKYIHDITKPLLFINLQFRALCIVYLFILYLLAFVYVLLAAVSIGLLSGFTCY